MKKKVSVIVPVYNVEDYLEKCLDSIMNQTLKDIEIIIVNDGSPDNSQVIIDEYKKKDKRIVSIVKENGGVGSARNLGLKKASGEYIAYIDSDDWIELDMLEKMYDRAKKTDSDIIICGYKNIYPSRVEDTLINDKIIMSTESRKNSRLFNPIGTWCKLYKRKFLLESDVLFTTDKVWYEDLSYTVKLLALTDKIDYVNLPLYNYLIRENSIMNSSKILKNLDLLISFNDIIDFFVGKSLYNKFYSELEFLAIEHILIYGVTRVCRIDGDKNTKAEVIKQFKNYINNKFPNYKKNKYLKNLSRNRKIIYNLSITKQYWLISLIFKIKK